MSLASAGNFVRFGLMSPLLQPSLYTEPQSFTNRSSGGCDLPMVLR